MKPQYTAQIPVGIGDIIYIHAQLNAVKNNFSKILLSPNFNLFRMYRDSNEKNVNENIQFTKDFCNLIFSQTPKFEITQNNNFPYKTSQSIWNQDGFAVCKPNLQHLLCTNEKIINNKYIVITTKVRELDLNIYLNVKSKLLNFLNNVSSKYKIVILGERNIEMTPEYLVHGHNKIYSIYNDIIKNIPKENIIDMSIEKMGKTSPQLSSLIKDCTIMKFSNVTISLGIGGNFCISSAISNVSNFSSYPLHKTTDYLYSNHKCKEIHVTSDINQFVNNCEIFL